jgi:hypothetical protein
MTSLRRLKLEELWTGRIAFGRARKRTNRSQREFRRVVLESRNLFGRHPRRSGWAHRQRFLQEIVASNRFRALLLAALRDRRRA